MSARAAVTPDSVPAADLTIINCVCEGRLRIGTDACGECAGTLESVLVLLDAAASDSEGNPVWILAWALSHIIGKNSVDWNTVRRLAAECEEPSLFQ